MFVSGEDSFYVSNFMSCGFGDKMAMKIDFALTRHTGSIVYVQDSLYQVAQSRLHYANGLAGNDKYVKFSFASFFLPGSQCVLPLGTEYVV